MMLNLIKNVTKQVPVFTGLAIFESSIRSVIYYIAKRVAANLPLSGGFPVFGLTLFTGYTV